LSAPTDNQIYTVPASQFSPSPGTTLVLGTTPRALCELFFILLSPVSLLWVLS